MYVRMYLQEAQLCHIQRSVEIERARRAAEEARSETSQLQTEAIQLLEKNYGQPGIEEEHLELAKYVCCNDYMLLTKGKISAGG